MAQNIIQPETLPPLDQAVKMFVEWRDKPSKILEGRKPSDLFRGLGSAEPDRIWFVGSAVWYPAVLGTPFPDDRDIDIVFHDQVSCEQFVDHVMRTFEGLCTKDTKPHTHGGIKILKDKVGIIDAWWLPEGVSIGEHIMSYKHDHEHVAILAGASSLEIGALLRLVRPLKYEETPSGIAEAKAAYDARAAQQASTWSDYSS